MLLDLKSFNMVPDSVTLTVLLHLILCYTAVSSVKVELSPAKPLFRVGDRQQLTCRMSKCSEKMTFSWGSLEDKPLYSETQMSLNESTLVFKSVNKNHENKIQCKATCQGKSKQAAVKVRVYSFPKDPVISGHDTLVLGKINTLTCQVSDVYPAEHMTLKWLKGGEVVHTQEGEYGIDSIQSKYTFIPQINNKGETIRCQATLSLDDLPREERTRETNVSMAVLCPPVNTVISVSPNNPKENEFMKISCVSDSSLMNRLVLSKVLDGKETELESGDGLRVSVTYHKATFSHSGVYMCKTTNACGTQTDNVTVTVGISSVKVELSPAKPLFRVGDRQQLTCRMSKCSEEMTFSWSSLEDKPLYSETQTSLKESTLDFKSVNKSHENKIQCKATCQGMSKKAAVNVRVYSFPKDPVISGHDTLVLGKNNTLTCQVSDVYPAEHMTVKWLKGGEVVHTQEGEYGIDSIQSKYTFTPQINNMGETIRCQATLSLDGLPLEERTRDTTVSMAVLSFPSEPIIESSGPFLEGKVTNLTCTVRGVFPVDSFHMQWLNGELELHSVRGNFSDKLQNLSLTIPFKPKDSDQNKTFTCKVSLKMGVVSTQKTASTTLVVHYPPKHTTINVRPQTKLNEGETMTISCHTESAPEGYVTLKRVRNGEEIKLVSSNGTQTSFTISFINMSHSGIYVCEATNKYGHQRENIQITVQAPPRNITVTVYPSKEVQEGGTITICCQSVSFPPSDIALRKLDNGNDIYSSNGTFLLVNLTSNDSGLYLVNATNALGSETEIFTINVTSKRKDDGNIYSVLLRKLHSIDFIIPFIGLGIMATVASSLDCIRRAKKMGVYEMTEAFTQETV
ncbi:hypothetical protein AMELA_G00136420 [Ameiurus melas]|uniref:Ig-like domain-containing protein n=1 Tax=Ameiurus melas TaxID=219545 RepID=A0A7J6AKJ8_AMEME|nr:hypothetical protein AMELA_G00136420 [Ameiurus melas]